MRIFGFYRTFLDRYARGQIVLILLTVTLAIYGYMIFHSIPGVMNYANGMKILDMMPTGYSHDYVRQLFFRLGEEGRRVYLYRQIPIDMLYPFFFAVTYSLLLAYMFKRAIRSKRWTYILSIIPVITGLADYLENIGIIVMLASFPQLSSGWVSATRVFSITKSSATMVFWLLLATGLILVAKTKLSSRQRESGTRDTSSSGT